jgi:hypothetical protein
MIANYANSKQSISLSGCTNVDDNALDLITRSCINLRRVTLSKTKVSERGIWYVCRRLPSVQFIDMKHLDAIYPQFLRELAESYPKVLCRHLGHLLTSSKVDWCYYAPKRLMNRDRMLETIEQERLEARKQKIMQRRASLSS